VDFHAPPEVDFHAPPEVDFHAPPEVDFHAPPEADSRRAVALRASVPGPAAPVRPEEIRLRRRVGRQDVVPGHRRRHPAGADDDYYGV